VSGAGQNTRWVEAHPWLDVLYAASENPSGDEALSRFDISNGGELAWVSSSGTHSGGRSVQLDPSGRYAYQVLDGAPGRIRAFRVADDGSLKATSSTDISAGPRAIAFHPGGRFAYVPCFDDDVIDVLEIDWASGALVPLTSILTGDGPLQIAIPSSGTHVLSLESSTSTVVVYRVRPVDGALEFLPGGFNDLGSGVSAIEVDPTAEHVFASGVAGSITRAYRLDAQTGALFSTGHEIASAPALALRIAPNARDLYATLPGGVIQRYEFDSGAGLTPRESLPAGASPSGLALRIRVR
jgi:6-phosphogluconolactonase (cycloisomerase 2 family)